MDENRVFEVVETWIKYNPTRSFYECSMKHDIEMPLIWRAYAQIKAKLSGKSSDFAI